MLVSLRQNFVWTSEVCELFAPKTVCAIEVVLKWTFEVFSTKYFFRKKVDDLRAKILIRHLKNFVPRGTVSGKNCADEERQKVNIYAIIGEALKPASKRPHIIYAYKTNGNLSTIPP